MPSRLPVFFYLRKILSALRSSERPLPPPSCVRRDFEGNKHPENPVGKIPRKIVVRGIFPGPGFPVTGLVIGQRPASLGRGAKPSPVPPPRRSPTHFHPSLFSGDFPAGYILRRFPQGAGVFSARDNPLPPIKETSSLRRPHKNFGKTCKTAFFMLT